MILVKPIITEKSMQNAGKNLYTFAVEKEANKTEIGRTVAQNFSVQVKSIRTMILKGKTKRAGRMRRQFTTSSWKKAIIEVPSPQKIDLFDVTENAKKP